MHILFITPSFKHKYNPLTSIFFEDQVNAVASNPDHKVGVISANFIPVLSFTLRGKIELFFQSYVLENINILLFNAISIPKMKRLNYLIRLSLLRILFKKYIRNIGLPDVIHVQQYDAGELALSIKKKYHIPFILTEHSTIFFSNIAQKWEYEIASRVYKESSYNIAVSHEFANFLKIKFNQPFTYLPNVVDTEFFVPGTFQKENYTFINVAILDKRKKQKMLIESFFKAFHGQKKYKLIIVGDGEQKEVLQNTIKNLDIGDQVKLFGKATREQIREILNNSNCFVLSSEYETFGIVLIEAMSCGIPVISTNSNGPLSIITDDKLGIICENSFESLSNALKEITAKEYDSDFIRKYCIDNYSVKAIEKKLNDIYESLLV